MKARAVAAALLLAALAAPAHGQAPAPAPPAPSPPAAEAARWELRVGHSYSSPRALTQPATAVLEQEKGEPLYSVLDAGALLRGSLAPRGWVELGLRAHAGSARPPRRRVYGAMARAYGELDPLLVAVGGEYLADGNFDVRQPAATLEITALGGAPGLGTWVSPGLRLRWRPWLGLSWGSGLRPYGRLAAELASGRVEAGLEATGWLVQGSAVAFLQGDVSVRLVGGLFLTASGEAGRAAPRFEPDGRLGVGLGFRLNVPL